ncbi:hypothetical protein SKAU_G00366010 [Synaphobranchus kaupii]|uniref:Uncharacterized protein n=1 Tax=Synaphobranchus kaupii TaxID=118154 RepID=A0A9Q1IEI8_SYNKA|nr:hypothetical protein SKAU_G00366010 [Synaphobranchus kaupii]
MSHTRQQVKLADLPIEQLCHMKKHASLTARSTCMLEGAGRMYGDVTIGYATRSKEIKAVSNGEPSLDITGVTAEGRNPDAPPAPPGTQSGGVRLTRRMSCVCRIKEL